MIARRQWVAVGEVILCSGYPTQLALTGGLRLAGLAPTNPDGGLSLTFVALLAALDTVLLLGLIAWLMVRRGETAAAVFFGGRPHGREALLGLALAPLILILISSAMLTLRWLWPALHSVPTNPLEALALSTDGFVVLLATAILAGGVREEVQRAFLLHRFRTDLGGGGVGLAITSAAFGIGHLLQGWDAVIVTALLGAIWGALYLARRSIVANVISHALANAAQIVAVYLR